ncbi:polysaccharide pyruvyl transferase family protein [Turicibacter bilis]|uniref:polysaccharide pyruvyl transferase family protein n=1 Tax=Turicibacter bilis TaxID=2735723 RepID=UPI0031BA36D9
MKTVKVYAYTNFNLGDDLFIKVLCDRYPETTFKLYAPALYQELFKDTSNLVCYNSESVINRAVNKIGRLFKIENLVDRYLVINSDLGIQIGGSLFIQGPEWVNYLENYEQKMRVKNKPFFLLGANFGPYTDQMFYERHKELFKNDTDICFRESYTYELFKDLDNTRYADDIVFSMKVKVSNVSNHVAISVIKPSYRKNLIAFDDMYYEKMKEIGLYYLSQGKEVIYMSFCEHEGDEEAVNEIISRIPSKYQDHVRAFYYRLNLDEALELLRTSKLVIACRFHAMILGFLYKKKVIPFVYSDKMKNVLDDLEFKGISCNISDISEFDTVTSLENLHLNQLDVGCAIQSAQEQFKHLDRLLNNIAD